MKKGEKITITKASGERVLFDYEKLRHSLLKSGASSTRVNTIMNEISRQLYAGISTQKIYRLAFTLLKSFSQSEAARYHLKQGIMALGPSGYPFEKFVAEILKHQGYQVQTGQYLQGHCVQHEVDVVAQNDHTYFMIECKYHNQPGTVCDVKVPLYIQSRFKDIEAAWLKQKEHSGKKHEGWVVTNTKFSTDAIQYGHCAGLQLMGWDYPQKNSLKALVDQMGLYPITCLNTLTQQEKSSLLEQGLLLCKSIAEQVPLLKAQGWSENKIRKVHDEALQLCTPIS